MHGKNWKQIEAHVQTRPLKSIMNHAQSFKMNIKKNKDIEGADLLSVL